jgi:hypothetical protein
MKKEKLLLIGLVVAALLALVAVGTVLGQEPEEPEESLPQSSPPEVSVDEGEEMGEVLPAAAVDAAFTYQGRLTDSGGSPVSDGVYDFEVQFWNGPDPSTAAQVGATIAATDTVSSGLFELTLPVIHADFNGQELYLRMRVSADGGTTWDDWTNTQPILPVPYALSLRPGATIGGTDAGDGGLTLRDSADNRMILFNAVVGNLELGPNSDTGNLTKDGDILFYSGSGAQAAHIDGAPASGGCINTTQGCTRIRGGLHHDDGDLELVSNDDIYFILDEDFDSGPIFAVYRQMDATTREDLFRIDNDGDVFADGGYHCGRSYDGTGFLGDLTESDLEAGPCLQDDTAADFAEVLPAIGDLGPGDVLVIGPDGKLASSTEAYQPTVVGVYTTRPSYVGGARLLGQPGYAPLAVMGIVPVKVSAENGSIQPGDLLVASSMPGHAMKADPNPSVGTVIGKALGALEEGTGLIDLLVMLQ